MSDSDSEENLCITPDIVIGAEYVTEQSLPSVSKKKYEKAYLAFINWRYDNKIESFSENVLLAYFDVLSKSMKSSTLWIQYSMLKSNLCVKNNIDISTYNKLKSYLKRKSENYQPKKSKILNSEDIRKFIDKAPDEKYLLTKVGLIIGIMGACRREELWKLKIDNVEDLGSALLVGIPDTKTETTRSFTIKGSSYEICKKYMSLRPLNLAEPRFFLNYQNGKCTNQVLGINKFGSMPKQVATYLKLPKPERYTGHCFRRSSATISVDAGADTTELEGQEGWESTSVAEGCTDDSMDVKTETADAIVDSVDSIEAVAVENVDEGNVPVLPSTSTSFLRENAEKRERMSKKMAEEKVQMQERSKYIENLKEQCDLMSQMKAERDQTINEYSLYGHFLSKVVSITPDCGMVSDLLDRYSLLSSTKRQLSDRLSHFMEELQSIKMNMVKQMNEIDEVKSSIWNVYVHMAQSKSHPIKIKKEDVEEQIIYIKRVLTELSKVNQILRREEKKRIATKAAAAAAVPKKPKPNN